MKVFVFIVSVLMALTLEAKTVEVKMLNFGADGSMVFEPGFVKIAKGDTIHFKPQDSAHSVTSRFLPDGAKGWNGKLNEAIDVTFDQEGVYIYQCDPHLAMGMVGVVQVGAAVNLDAAKAEAKSISKAFVMNKDRLDKFLNKTK